MGKFSIRRIITMILLIACGIVAITFGIASLYKSGDAYGGQNVKDILSDGGPFDNYINVVDKDHPDAQIFLVGVAAKYGAYSLIISGCISFATVILGLILTAVKGKSFGVGFLIFAILTVLFVIAFVVFTYFIGAANITDADWINERIQEHSKDPIHTKK